MILFAFAVLYFLVAVAAAIAWDVERVECRGLRQEAEVLQAAVDAHARSIDDLESRLKRQAEMSMQLVTANEKLHSMLNDKIALASQPVRGQLDLPLPDLPVREDRDPPPFDPFDADSHATMVFLGGPPAAGEVAYTDQPQEDEG